MKLLLIHPDTFQILLYCHNYEGQGWHQAKFDRGVWYYTQISFEQILANGWEVVGTL